MSLPISREVFIITSKKIRDIALKHFSEFGYESTSLNNIAEEVGIRKASIYAHYKGKDEIFKTVLHHALRTEKAEIANYFTSHQHESLENILRGYFDWLKEESKNNECLKFLMRVVYFPPPNLRKETSDLVNPFLTEMYRHLSRFLREKSRVENMVFSNHYSSIALTFITLSEGCFIELLFAEEKSYEARVNAAFPIFWQGVHCD
ncbi:hypothetical protein CIL05_18990 [Virgibacillus profundi]|uniref:HTH tetR-type domain-containing protein n=2 Tax=Virgibacillus profundi TaxID=2024555 RepID=A0A2A2I9I2_9BACI|nr:hypothetical protein CIL05_18990 [Virgibacillus profundi]PXY52206.1 TetR/AcrR family transcriptional regulator [Virgibacillus profundi]